MGVIMMVYVLKLIASLLLPPGSFVVPAAVLAVLLWRRRVSCLLRVLSLLLAVLLYLACTPLGARTLALPLEVRCVQQSPAAAQAIVVLGGGSVGGVADGAEIGNVTAVGAARLLTAARLARQHGLPVIVSGGQVFADGASEARIGRRILLQLGLADDMIIVEDKARTTQENAAYTAQLCRERGYKSVLLLTSALHMPRSLQHFERYLTPQGVDILTYPCDYTLNPDSSFNARQLLPQPPALDITCMALHEYVGMAGAWLQW